MARLFAVDEDGIVSVSSVAAAIQVVKVDDAWVMFVGGGVYGLSATLIGDDLTVSGWMSVYLTWHCTPNCARLTRTG